MFEASTAPLRAPAGPRCSTGRRQGHRAYSRGRVTKGDMAYGASATASALVAQDGFRDCTDPFGVHGGGGQGDLWTGQSQARAVFQLLELILFLELQLEVGNIRVPTDLEVLPSPTPDRGTPLSPTS